MTEEDKIQCGFVRDFKKLLPTTLMWHTPNGGSRNVMEGAKFKRMGVLPGVPDIFIPVPKKGKHGMFIELKSKNGSLSPAQKQVITQLEELGYEVMVFRSSASALEAAIEYLT